jgi:TRAP-type C4-dicarboxylate transport system permease small subunit
MKRSLKGLYRFNISLQIIAGIGLAFMMVVTLLDIILRAFGRPLTGAIELVSFSGAIIIGFAVPHSSWVRAHVNVDILVVRLSPAGKRIMEFCTRLVGVALFILMGVNFILYGLTLAKTGEVTPVFRIPYYPITFGLALACFIESLTLFSQLWGGQHD